MSNCALCDTPNGFTKGGWLCLEPYEDDAGTQFRGVACRDCTIGLVCSWAKEQRRMGQDPKNSPTPTNSPTGAGTPFVELLSAVA